MIFQSSMGLGKSRCDVPNGNIQEWACPFSVIKKSSVDSVHEGDFIILHLECRSLGRSFPFSFQTTCKKRRFIIFFQN